MSNQVITNYTDKTQELVISPLANGNVGINTEHIINNKTYAYIPFIIYMHAGSGDVNHGSKQSGWESNREWWTYDGTRGNFINLAYDNNNYSVIGGSGSISGLQKRESYYWHVDRDSSGNQTGAYWRHTGTNYFNDYAISREGQRKNIMLLFKPDTQIRINFTCYGANAFKGEVRLIPLFYRKANNA